MRQNSPSRRMRTADSPSHSIASTASGGTGKSGEPSGNGAPGRIRRSATSAAASATTTASRIRMFRPNLIRASL